ncbi:MAG: hypothetical protein V1748_04790 [Actinomycetota bacterium]
MKRACLFVLIILVSFTLYGCKANEKPEDVYLELFDEVSSYWDHGPAPTYGIDPDMLSSYVKRTDPNNSTNYPSAGSYYRMRLQGATGYMIQRWIENAQSVVLGDKYLTPSRNYLLLALYSALQAGDGVSQLVWQQLMSENGLSDEYINSRADQVFSDAFVSHDAYQKAKELVNTYRKKNKS